MVDKSVIFMNNVAAVQELAERNEAMWAQVSTCIDTRNTGSPSPLTTAAIGIGDWVVAQIELMCLPMSRECGTS